MFTEGGPKSVLLPESITPSVPALTVSPDFFIPLLMHYNTLLNYVKRYSAKDCTIIYLKAQRLALRANGVDGNNPPCVRIYNNYLCGTAVWRLT